MSERWILRNLTNKMITIGDLPRIPPIGPRKLSPDILVFYTRNEIAESKVLQDAFRLGLLKLQKIVDSITTTYTDSNAQEAILMGNRKPLLSSAVLQWKKFTLSYTDFRAAAFSKMVEIEQFPGGTVIMAGFIRRSEVFSNRGDPFAANFAIRSANNPTTTNNFCSETVMDEGSPIGDYPDKGMSSSIFYDTVSGSMTFVVIFDNAGGDYNLDSLTQGSLDIWVLVSNFNETPIP